ncbi:MAG: hypothetical protein ACFKPT_09150 [Gloeotrichia echinulata GP01]|nr:hypothetical protein [Gloeotrichia echinulata DEX184]
MQKQRWNVLFVGILVFISILILTNFTATAQTPTLRYDVIETGKRRVVCVNERSAQLVPSQLSPFHPAGVDQTFGFSLNSPAGRYAFADVSINRDGAVRNFEVNGYGAMCYSHDDPRKSDRCEVKVWSRAKDKVPQPNCSSGVLCVDIDVKTNVVGVIAGSPKPSCGAPPVQDQQLPVTLQKMGCRAPINVKSGMSAQKVRAEDSQDYWCFR